MTVMTDLKAITLTANAKSTGMKEGTDLSGLILQAERVTAELQAVLKQIVAMHPTGGADATVLAALNSVISELA